MINNLCVNLESLEDTRALARVFAALVQAGQTLRPAGEDATLPPAILPAAPAATLPPVRLLLFYGGLGAGKTTLARFLVEGLAGGENAEVASPSFTLCNEYPTSPKTLHFDLYRLEDGKSDENFEEALDALQGPNPPLVLVEWAERLCLCEQDYFPENYLACHLTADGNRRAATLALPGKDRARMNAFLQELLQAAGLAACPPESEAQNPQGQARRLNGSSCCNVNF